MQTQNLAQLLHVLCLLNLEAMMTLSIDLNAGKKNRQKGFNLTFGRFAEHPQENQTGFVLHVFPVFLCIKVVSAFVGRVALDV